MGLSKSKVVDASTAISAKAARIFGVSITGGSDPATVFLTDGANSAATQKTATLSVGTGVSDHWTFPNGIQCATGIYAEISGTTPDVAVEYED